MQCTQCGAAVVATARFCPVCGQAFNGTGMGNGSTYGGAAAGNPTIHDAQTLVMQRAVTTPVAVDGSRSPAEVASLVAGVGKAMVVSHWQRWWWKILIIGVGLYMVVNNVTFSTANIFLLPQLFMIGTFLVPIVYTAYLYEDGTLYDVPLSKIALTFFFGGIIGTLAASLLEARLITGNVNGIFGSLTLGNAFIVSFSEELAKLIVVLPFLLVARRRYPTVMHGIVLGAAAGMGFAAFESMGYAFLALVSTPGGIAQSIAAMYETIRLRALLAPLGHGTWTAIVAAAMWREQVNHRPPLTLNVLTAYLMAVLLHGLWNYLPPLRLPLLGIPLSLLVIGVIGLLILRFFIVVAKGGRDGAYQEANLARAMQMYFGGLRDEFRGKAPRSRP